MAEPIRVLFVLPSLVGGGAERVLCTLLKHIDRERSHSALALFNKTGEYLGEVPHDVDIIDLGKRSRWDALRLVVELRRLIRRERPHVLLSVLEYTNILTLLSAVGFTGTRVVVKEANDPTHALALERFGGMKRWLIRVTYPKAARIVAISHGIKQCLERHFNVPSRQIEVIHNPIDLDDAASKMLEPISHPFLQGSNGDALIVSAGRLVPQKNFPLLLQAIAHLKDDLPLRLIVLGQGPLRGQLLRLAKELGIEERVDFVGFQKNPYAWMSKADAFVLSSDYEGFGNVIVEAMACGVPVIATNCSSGPAEIISHRHDGLLVPPGDAVGLAAAIREIVSDKQLGKTLTERAVVSCRRFAVDTVVARYETLIAQAATG